MRIPSLLLLLALAAPLHAGHYDGPVIDVHLHAGAAAPGAINPATGKPTTANTDADRDQHDRDEECRVDQLLEQLLDARIVRHGRYGSTVSCVVVDLLFP